MSGTYERIWLQCPNTDPENEWCGETTWCQDKINDEDVEYVRGDLVESLRQRVAELEGAVEFHRETTRNMAMDFEEELAALKAGCNALAEFNEHWQEDDGNDPIERLSFFCSLAMRGQDWLDVEPFFDALKQAQGEPVAQVDVETVDVYSNYIQWLTEDLPIHGTKLYTSAPTIPEG